MRASQFGFTQGDRVFWVEEPKDQPAVIHECAILRFTKERVWIGNDQIKKCVPPHKLHRARPALKRQTDPLQDVIARHSYGLPETAPIGKSMMTTLNTLKGQIVAARPDLTADDLDRIYATAEITPSRPESILAMIKRYYDQQDQRPGMSYDDTPSHHEATEPIPTPEDMMEKAARQRELTLQGRHREAINYTYKDLYRERAKQQQHAA